MALKWTLRMLNVMQEMGEAWLDVYLKEIFLTTVEPNVLVKLDGKKVILTRVPHPASS